MDQSSCKVSEGKCSAEEEGEISMAIELLLKEVKKKEIARADL